jgi:hypothetical protein
VEIDYKKEYQELLELILSEVMSAKYQQDDVDKKCEEPNISERHKNIYHSLGYTYRLVGLSFAELLLNRVNHMGFPADEIKLSVIEELLRTYIKDVKEEGIERNVKKVIWSNNEKSFTG